MSSFSPITEFDVKLKRVRQFLKEKSLRGLLLSTRANFSWLTCGRTNHVRWSADKGVASLWVTHNKVELWTNQIEEPRFKTEETKGLLFLYRSHPWWRDDKKVWLPQGRVGSDDGAYGTLDLKEEVSTLRWSLTNGEVARYRRVGKLAGEAIGEAAKRVQKGWTEQQAAAELVKAMVQRKLEPVLVLVGADERLKRFRHPIPKPNRIRKTVMLVLCARDQGLIANITRLVHFGKLPEELKKKHQACLQVECALWNASLPGVEIRKPFQAGVREYARQGYRDEWEKHHQGGPCSYEARDYFAGPTERRKIQKNQGIAWNPSITGTKSEDTILVTDMGVELLTPTPNWPMLKVEYCGKTYLRPNILERK